MGVITVITAVAVTMSVIGTKMVGMHRSVCMNGCVYRYRHGCMCGRMYECRCGTMCDWKCSA